MKNVFFFLKQGQKFENQLEASGFHASWSDVVAPSQDLSNETKEYHQLDCKEKCRTLCLVERPIQLLT